MKKEDLIEKTKVQIATIKDVIKGDTAVEVAIVVERFLKQFLVDLESLPSEVLTKDWETFEDKFVEEFRNKNISASNGMGVVRASKQILTITNVLEFIRLHCPKQKASEQITFIVDGEHQSKPYSIMELLDKTPEDIMEDMEVCNCKTNESVPHCEGDCIRFDQSSITGFRFT